MVCLGSLFILAIVPAYAPACHMEFDIDPETDINRSIGDTLTVKLTLMLTHRNCQVDITDTEFITNGLDILGATRWKQVRQKPVIMEKNKGRNYRCGKRRCIDKNCQIM